MVMHQLIYSDFMQNGLQIFKRNVTRFPRLDTVVMIEDSIRKAKGDLTVRQVWQKLPKKVMWQTYLTALDYLEFGGKIHIEEDRHIAWIWSPNEIEKLKKKGLVTK